MDDMEMDMMEQPPMPPQDPMMGGDPNAMPPEPMEAEPPMGDAAQPQADGDVDNDVEQAAGTLSNILPDANESTVDYAMKMITKAVAKNPNVGDNNISTYVDNLQGGDDNQEDENAPQDDMQQPPMQESYSRIDKLIDEALNDIFNNVSEDRPEGKLERGYMRDKQNPFVSPINSL